MREIISLLFLREIDYLFIYLFQQQTTTPMQQQMNHVDSAPKVEVKSEVKPVVPSLLGNKGPVVPSLLAKGPVVPSLLRKNNDLKDLKPTLMLNKLSKEDEELMQKSLKLYAKENPQRAQDLGVTDQRGQIKSSRSRIQNKYSDGGSDSDSDEEGSNEPKKLRSKFFRATEKERDEQKRLAKEERRKRKFEDGFEGAGNLLFKLFIHTQRARKF